MYGTLRGKTIRIKSIHVHYDLAVPAEAREATERASARGSRPSRCVNAEPCVRRPLI